LFENTQIVGKYLGTRLEEIKDRHLSVGDIRYIGLFTAIEIVNNRITKQPIDPLADIGNYLRDHGLFTFIFHNVIFVVPPLCITKSQVDEGLEIIDNAIMITDRLYEA
jgi:taurine--2-oxoglutarate transaminase